MKKESYPPSAFASYFPFWLKLTDVELMQVADIPPDSEAILLVVNLNQKTWETIEPYFSQYKKTILIQFEAMIGWNLAYEKAKLFDYFISFDRTMSDHPGFRQMHIPYNPDLASSGRDKRGAQALTDQWKSSRKLFIDTYFLQALPRKRKGVLIATLNPNDHYQIRKTIADKWPNEVDIFGGGWPKSMPNYRGYISSKVDVLKRYRYCLVMENQRQNGYITEKFLDCLPSATVPIYWGAPDIHEYPHLDWVPTIENETSAIDQIIHDDKLYKKTLKRMIQSRKKIYDSFSTERFITMVSETIKECYED